MAKKWHSQQLNLSADDDVEEAPKKKKKMDSSARTWMSCYYSIRNRP